MELVLPAQKLKEALPYLTKYIGKAKKAPSTYIGLQFYIRNNNLTLIGFDGTSGIRFSMGKVAIDNLSVTIEYTTFEQVVHYTEAQDVKFWFEDTGVKISCGKSKYTLRYLDMYYDTCFDYTLSGTPWLTASVADISKVFKFNTHYICADDNMFFLKGIYYDGNFVSTDTKTVGIYPYKPKIQKGYMLPKQMYERIASFPNKEKVFAFYEYAQAVVYTSEGIECYTQLLNGKFPNYAQVVTNAMANTYNITVDKTEIVNACERLIPFNDPKTMQKVNVVITQEALTLSTGTVEKDREGIETIDIKQSNIDKTFSFVLNLKKLLIILATATDDEIKISFKEDLSTPIKIETASGAMVLDCVIQSKKA